MTLNLAHSNPVHLKKETPAKVLSENPEMPKKDPQLKSLILRTEKKLIPTLTATENGAFDFLKMIHTQALYQKIIAKAQRKKGGLYGVSNDTAAQNKKKLLGRANTLFTTFSWSNL